MAQETDAELMREYLAGDSSAFEALYGRFSGRVYGYLLAKLGRREEADEVFQMVFQKFHQSRASYDPAYPVLQWLFVLSRSVLLDHFRKQRRQVAVVDDADLNAIPAEVSQTGAALTLSGQEEPARMLEALRPEQREIVSLRVLDELSYAQIAERLGKSQESVRQTFSRAMRRLRANRSPR